MTDREKSQGNLRDEQTRAAVEQAEKAEAKRDRAEGREGEAPEYEPGPDGCVHIMEEEMKANAENPLTKKGEETQPPAVVHVMELQMKGEALAGAIDPTPPDPEAPIDARKGDDRQPEPVQYPAAKQRR